MRNLISVLLTAILLSGCSASIKNMREMPANTPDPDPQPGKALIVFLRPSNMAYAVQSSLFQVQDNNPSLVGIIAAKSKVAWHVDPGSHLFMVTGESADFMSAEFAADKTYYALVTPRMGMWKARFSLRPVSRGELDGAEFGNWLKGCKWVEKNADSESWAAGNMGSIKDKQAAYYPKWMAKHEMERPRLRAEDAR